MAKNSGSENIVHLVAVRLRLTGSGVFNMQVTDLDQDQTKVLVPIDIDSGTAIEVTRLTNIQSQRLRFEAFVENIDESFHIRRIILFAKPIAVEYPM